MVASLLIQESQIFESAFSICLLILKIGILIDIDISL